MSHALASSRWVALHADDFGMNSAVNSGILQSFRDGLLTSTSLLANAPAADEACRAWTQLSADVRDGAISSAQIRRKLGDNLQPFDLGIHLNLTQGRPLTATYPTELLNERGQFPGIAQVFRHLRSAESQFSPGILAELRMQIERMLDHGLQPTHMNGHQYVELMPAVAALIPRLCSQYSIRVVRVAHERHLISTVLVQGRVMAFAVALIKRFYARRFESLSELCQLVRPSRFFGTAHAGLVTRTTLFRFLRYSGSTGCTEIGLHPSIAAATEVRPSTDEWFDPLAANRPAELEWLCDSSIGDKIVECGLSLGRLSHAVLS